jgi:hypothetical protein
MKEIATLRLFVWIGFAAIGCAGAEGEVPPMLKQHCFSCHGKAAMAGLNLQALSADLRIAEQFHHWEKVAAVLEEKRMPPPKVKQPDEAERQQTAAWIRARLQEAAAKNAGDPGKVTVRRLTSGEYGYTIQDLTGIEIKTDKDFAGDSVGGEGFTNFGDVQFMQDANLERYLAAAKRVADHAVIGSGPIQFYADPGKSGLELSALNRIQNIYNTFGFRAASGEGGKPFGLERFDQAFAAAWVYENRAKLGQPSLTLAKIAEREGISVRFAQHVYAAMKTPNPPYPLSEVVSRWKSLPAPTGKNQADLVAASSEVRKYLVNWTRSLFGAGELAEGGQGDERALVITDDAIQAKTVGKLRQGFRTREGKPVRVYVYLASMNPKSQDRPVVVFKNAVVRYRGKDRAVGKAEPLRAVITEESAAKLAFGKMPGGGDLDPLEFAAVGETEFYFDVKVPEGGGGADVQLEVALGPKQAGDAVMRATISDREVMSKGRPVSVLLGYEDAAGYKAWKSDVLQFAAALPMISHREVTPSDKDPIPAPYNNEYNQPERDLFHVKLKYYRGDSFLREKMLDDKTRIELDQAWNDLLGSFEYHDAFLNFVASKFQLNLGKKALGDLSPGEVEAIPAEPRKYVKALRTEYDAVRKALRVAQPGHVEDVVKFASRTWRRPLSVTEQQRLRAFYAKSRETLKLDHAKAIRAMIARVLVSPNFLYRMEKPGTISSSVVMRPVAAKPAAEQALTGYELASRLSYFLWSSTPDAELLRAASSGELTQPAKLEAQVKRMLHDPKARRFAIEFFGQWLGFYRFDQYTGVDTGRFPEFTDELKSGMYQEAVSFFEHVVRKDRPVGELFAADYTFLTPALAKFYGAKVADEKKAEAQMVSGANAFGRGGMLRLGAVLTVTSAPLRTSPVKRGDWMLRRVLGTPTPPPPADAGSIPADEKNFGGLSLKEKLAAHQRNATCAGCHSRIDPLGFPFEKYDAIGRTRTHYSDGKPISDSSVSFDQKAIDGIDGLVSYLNAQEPLVLRNFAKKLLGYSLGRTMLVTDQPLLDQLASRGSSTPLSQWITEIVLSKQFRYRRGADEEAPERKPAKQQVAAMAGDKQNGRSSEE